MSMQPYDYTDDEAVELPDVWNQALNLPSVLVKWYSINLQRMVNNPYLDKRAVDQALPVMQNLYDLLIGWETQGRYVGKDDLKSMRYWWGLFMHLYGPREGK